VAKTQVKLQQMLDALDAAMPGFLQQHTNEKHFWASFSVLVDEIDSVTAPDDVGWVLLQIDVILKKQGILKRPEQST
jgi:hypothetical protein